MTRALALSSIRGVSHKNTVTLNCMSRSSKKQSAPKEILGDRWWIFAICILLATGIWLVFGQTLQHEFINFDDNAYVYENPPVVRGLSFGGVAWAFTQVHSANWHPLTWISHMLDCQFYGLNPAGHHLTNILLHAVTAILLFVILRQMTGAGWRSAFVAAVFAIHPLRVESVAWAAERKDVLSGLFFMLTILAYVNYVRRDWSARRYALVVVSFALGLMCKPMLVTVPFVLFLLDYWPLNRLPQNFKVPRRLIWEKLPLLALATASCAITLFAQRSAMQPIARTPLLLRMGNAVISYVDYLRQMFWPADLAILYPWEAARIGVLRTVLSLIVITGACAIIILLRQRRYLVMGWLWYLVMLVPVIGIFQVGNQARADRYTYLPQIGLYLMLTWAAADVSAGLRARRFVLSTVAAAILLALLLAARTQTSYWRDSETLWAHALACTTNNSTAEGNLGQACYARGKTDEAMAHFQQALRIDPSEPSVHSSLGVFYLDKGEVEQALAHLQRALEIEPNFADAHYNLGNTFLQMAQPAEAVAHYDKALQINPSDTQALNNMAWVLATWPDARVRDGPRAVRLANEADSLTRNKSPIISATLAAAYAEAGRFPEAITTAERALHLAMNEGNTARVNSIRGQLDTYASGAAVRDNRYATPPQLK